MGEKSKIQWTEATWSPIRARNLSTGKVGWHCTHVSPGCLHCYSESLNRRLGTGLDFKPGHRRDIDLFLDEKMLLAPLRWRRGRMVFVCSMTDLFADFVPDEWIDRVFAVMALAPQHTFQVLTKRPERMRSYMLTAGLYGRVLLEAGRLRRWRPKLGDIPISNPTQSAFWPQLWCGTSCEDQARADERIPHLLATPAAVRFISAEPLLAPIDLGRIRFPHGFVEIHGGHLPAIGWLIVGGESGRDARPMDLAWARSLVEQCRSAGTACFVKQLGSKPVGEWGETDRRPFMAGHWRLNDRKGGDIAEFPPDLRVREMP